jgi:hypothetical protein
VAPPGVPPGRWVRRDDGPVVRPYAVTGGRTEPDGEVLDLIAVVVATGMGDPADDEPLRRIPEHRKILARCQQQATVADIASETALPLGVAVTVMRHRPPRAQLPGNEVLQEILNGLRAL